MRTFISFQEARRVVMEAAAPLGNESVSLREAAGRTLAQAVVSSEDIPPFNNSAMDGYAVLAEDCASAPVWLEVVADIPAGRLYDGEIQPATCARIMTGAPLPSGADAVVPVEKTREEGGHVWIDEAPAKGVHVRLVGEDVKKGEKVFNPGCVITPPVVGMLATLGFNPVSVVKRPEIVVISTGDELVASSKTPGPGQIRNSNGPALAAQVESAGGVAKAVLHAPDNPEDIRKAVEAGMGGDIFLFSGGVSMGAYDYVRTELENMGATWDFWKVNQRPGKPLVFGRYEDTLLFGLPGNPVSSAMCFEMYCRPLLARMLKRDKEFRDLQPAILSHPMKKVKGLYYFARGIVDDAGPDGIRMVRDTGPQGSNLYSSVVNANCIIHLLEDMENPEEGTEVLIETLDW
ncbi:MAG: molybdopterin molybdotransferase MoeA [Rhodothermia bacterium]|nr:MAG: molybdopterin molybdotransferase MoeA [Rhodothermia bacterium]